MTFFKSVSIFLMAAIANPMCCFLEGASSMTEVPTAHACCQLSQDEDREQQSPKEHSTSDCPHSWEKDSQIRQSVDLGDSLSKPLANLASALPAFAAQREFDLLEDKLHSLRRDSISIPTPPIAQSYCVYLL